MSPASRRIFLYWLLLLIPTLVVGGLAIQLLRREQSRIATQAGYAQDARRAAAMTRARLVVENVELLVGDVQAALLDTLASESDGELDGFLEQWEKNNPLVRTAFLCRADGELIRPSINAPGDDPRGFARRFSSILRDRRPWAAEPPNLQMKDSGIEAEKTQTQSELARQEISSNVAQVQSARRDVQELAKTRDYPSSKARAAAQQSFASAAEADASIASTAANGDNMAGVSRDASSIPREQKSTESRAAEPYRVAGKKELAVAAPQPMQLRDQSPDRRGWSSVSTEGRLHLIGWIQPGGSDLVRGVELEMAGLIGRLGGALPAEVLADEGYAIRDEQGRVLHQIGRVRQSGEALVSVPLSNQLLPGWSVAVFLLPPIGESIDGTSFFWTSALLVALFVAAILAGGSLLLRQARRSELEALQKTSFVANVSHEFKTPLTTIRLYSELLEQGRVRDAQQGGDYLRTIGRETERLARLVNNALDFSRLEQGQKKYSHERIDLVAELRRLVETHSRRIEESGLTLRSELPDEPMQVTTDRDAVEQIVLNLLDNASKYAPAGGEVVVSVFRIKGGTVEVVVADRGPGVQIEQQEKIFEKFYRVNDSLTAEKAGAGLGLSIARQLARGLGGDLYYRGRAGGGAEFVFNLP